MADVQVRFENGALAYFPTVKEAMEKADNNPTIWKISFDTPWGERIRLVKKEFHKRTRVFGLFFGYTSLLMRMEMK